MFSKLKRGVRHVAGSILEMDDTCIPYEQLEILNDFLSKYQFNLSTSDMNRLLKELKRKHLVDSILVMDKSGELVVSSEGNGNAEAASAATLLKFIDSELATPESVLIKGSRGWFMVFPFQGKAYVVKAQASMSNVELKALAKEIGHFASEIEKAKSAEYAVSQAE